MVQFNMNAANEEKVKELSAIPLGLYTLALVDSEQKTTKDGTGWYIKATFAVLDEGDFKDRKVFQNYNLGNKNPEAVAIARKELATLIAATKPTDQQEIEDTSELYGIPFTGKVGIEKAQEGFEPKNKMVNYYPLAEMTAEQFTEGMGAIAVDAAVTTGGAAPWDIPR